MSGAPGDSGGAEPPHPTFPARVVMTLTSPGALGDALRERPTWFMTGLLGAVIVLAGTGLIPPEVWEEFQRAQLLAAGREVPEGFVDGSLIRNISLSAAGLVWFIALFIASAVLAFVFAFILGDEGRYVQYLAAVSHANLIGALGSLVTAPLKIAQRDPQLTLSVGTFLEGSLGDGFLLFFLRGLDLFALWSWVVLGILVSRIDRERSVGSAMGAVFTVFLAVVAVFAFVGARFAS